jgi:hypothetical protein
MRERPGESPGLSSCRENDNVQKEHEPVASACHRSWILYSPLSAGNAPEIIFGFGQEIHMPTIVYVHGNGNKIASDPLGVTEVQDLVVRPLQVPVPVAQWRNISDFRDLVALDHTVRPEFDPATRCADLSVVNDSWNHHGIGEYLATVAIRQPILQIFHQ